MAALPLAVLFVLLGVVRMRAWLASLIGLLVALLVGVLAYAMPVGDALNSGLLGAAFGLFPIMWIVINAIWVYNLTVETGHFDVLRRSFASISDDQRIQAIIIAFCFGALMEALAGFGTPVAISSVMLIALGFRPLKAAAVALVANTAPVAFGALAVPITTLAAVTKLPVDDLGAMVGRQTPILSVFVGGAYLRTLFRSRVWRPALVRAGLLGTVEPDGPKYRGTWTNAAGESRSELLASEAAAVNHVARHQAGGLRFHDLRHSYATWLVDDGVPVNMVQRVLGHERSSTTLDLYTRRTDDPTRVLRALDDGPDDDPDGGAAGALVPR